MLPLKRHRENAPNRAEPEEEPLSLLSSREFPDTEANDQTAKMKSRNGKYLSYFKGSLFGIQPLDVDFLMFAGCFRDEQNANLSARLVEWCCC